MRSTGSTHSSPMTLITRTSTVFSSFDTVADQVSRPTLPHSAPDHNSSNNLRYLDNTVGDGDGDFIYPDLMSGSQVRIAVAEKPALCNDA